MSQRQQNSILSSLISTTYWELILILRRNLMYAYKHCTEHVCNFPQGIFLFDSITSTHSAYLIHVHFTIWPIKTEHQLQTIECTRTTIIISVSIFMVKEPKNMHRVPNTNWLKCTYVLGHDHRFLGKFRRKITDNFKVEINYLPCWFSFSTLFYAFLNALD